MKMSSSTHGSDTLISDGVTNITNIGFWILIDRKEYFVPFDYYPHFRKASIDQIADFKLLSPKQLHWESLDCDIELDALSDPKVFPLHFSE
jgi:hypothetical protein